MSLDGTGLLLRATAFVLLSLAVIYYALLPLPLLTARLVQPDLVLALAAAWAVREPESLPLIVLAPILLLADFALNRPVGLWALLSLLAIEALAGQREPLRNRPFPFEMAAFAAVLGAALLLQAVILRVALVDRPGGEIPLQLFATTVAAYPVVVLILHYILRVRAPKPAERSRRLGRVG